MVKPIGYFFNILECMDLLYEIRRGLYGFIKNMESKTDFFGGDKGGLRDMQPGKDVAFENQKLTIKNQKWEMSF